MILNDPLDRARELAEAVPPMPWRHYIAHDGALILETVDGEPLALIYGGMLLVQYLEAVAPATLFPTGVR